MSRKLPSNPLPRPASTSTSMHADTVVSGEIIPAIERIRLFSDRQWEEFVLEWADSLREIYCRVERCGGAGDMGRDVIAMCKKDDSVWDNYQCTLDVKEVFYRSIAEEFENNQIIILENEEPPDDIEQFASFIKFTGGDHGRKGFIPEI